MEGMIHGGDIEFEEPKVEGARPEVEGPNPIPMPYELGDSSEPFATGGPRNNPIPVELVKKAVENRVNRLQDS